MRTTGFAGLSRPLMILLAIFALAPAGTASALHSDQQGGAAGLGNAHISYLDGDVLLNSEDTSGWAAAAPNLALREGDRLWVGEESRLELMFRGGQYAWVNYKSELDIIEMDAERGGGGDTYQVSLPFGEATFSVRNFRELGSVFQVETPSASVRAYEAARFRVVAMSDGSTQVGVYDGTVEVESADGIASVREGDLMEVTARGRPFVSGLPGEDSWDRWVDSRVERYDRSYGRDRYLPVDLRGYAYEFEGYGRWANDPLYGFVWVPAVDPLWSPYSNGRWVWAGGHYVWLSYDPWYTPFHFGRWAWTVSLGWYWVPPGFNTSIYWSPGYVGWSYGPDELFWVPLAPGEIYYGYGYYGPASVNIINVRTYSVANVYVNSRVRHGVVRVRRDDFLGGKTKRVRVGERDNPFEHRDRKGYRLIGRPPVEEVKPTLRTRLPEPERKVTEKMRPPDWVGRHYEDIRRERSAARKSGESAFRGVERPRRIREVPTGRPPGIDATRERDMRAPGRERDVLTPPRGGGIGTAPARPRDTERDRPAARERVGEPGGGRRDRDGGRPQQPENERDRERTRDRETAPDARGQTAPERPPVIETPAVQAPETRQRRPERRVEPQPERRPEPAPVPERLQERIREPERGTVQPPAAPQDSDSGRYPRSPRRFEQERSKNPFQPPAVTPAPPAPEPKVEGGHRPAEGEEDKEGDKPEGKRDRRERER